VRSQYVDPYETTEKSDSLINYLHSQLGTYYSTYQLTRKYLGAKYLCNFYNEPIQLEVRETRKLYIQICNLDAIHC
jgi:hypothetical protein